MEKVLLVLTTLTLFSGCIRKECRNVSDINFRLTIDYAPLLDTLRVGDTIHIFSEFSDEIVDVNSVKTYKVENFDFFSALAIKLFNDNNLAPLNISIDQISDENFEYDIFNFTSGGSMITINEHSYEANTYNFSFDYIVKETGLYIIAAESFLGQMSSTDAQLLPSQCPNQEIKAQYFRLEADPEILEKYNYNLFRSVDFSDQITEDEFRKYSYYAFHAKE